MAHTIVVDYNVLEGFNLVVKFFLFFVIFFVIFFVKFITCFMFNKLWTTFALPLTSVSPTSTVNFIYQLMNTVFSSRLPLPRQLQKLTKTNCVNVDSNIKPHWYIMNKKVDSCMEKVFKNLWYIYIFENWIANFILCFMPISEMFIINLKLCNITWFQKA